MLKISISSSPFCHTHTFFPLVSIGNCKVVVLPEIFSLEFFIWWNNRNHFTNVFKEHLSGIHWHVCFCKWFQILKSRKKHKMHVQQLCHSYRVSGAVLLLNTCLYYTRKTECKVTVRMSFIISKISKFQNR